jgi:DNA-directed RNA polymerase specialized sigma24 family protein
MMNSSDPQQSELDQKVARLATALSADAPATEQLRAVEVELRRWLRSYEPRVDTEAVAQEAIMRVFDRMRAAPSEEIRYPARLLRVVAQRLALDQIRSAWVQRTEPMPAGILEHPSDDDAIAALLSREATAQLVAKAMKTAAQRKDHLVIRCVAVWLDLAERRGAPPTTRDVAALAGVSHTSVRNALSRFRDYLSQ